MSKNEKGEIKLEMNQEIMSNVITAVAPDLIKFGWEKVKKFFSNITEEKNMKYKTSYEKYLSNTKLRNSKIKTIIYRRVPKDLYSFYENINLKYDHKNVQTNSIKELIKINSKIIITGTGGGGKSILFKHLFLNTIDETEYIPVLIELRSLNVYNANEILLYDIIYKNLEDNGFELEKSSFDESLKKGAYIIFLDGYDEINKEKVEKIKEEIKKFSNKYEKNKYFLSSRPTIEFISWNNFSEMETLPLNKKQALNLIEKIDFDSKVKKIFYEELKKELYKNYESFASNPLLLTIMLMTFEKHASIPKRLNDFYEEAFVTLFSVHDATKDSYVRDIQTGLGCEDFKLIFSYICFKSYFNGEYEFSETVLMNHIQKAKEKFDKYNFRIEDFQEDLTSSVCMLVKDGLNYRFSHRSFQEYFAAFYTCKLLDEEQSKLLSIWIEESIFFNSDLYFNMLFNLQSDKVNKIILLPIILKLKELYDKNKFTLDLLKELFSEIKIRKSRVTNKYKEFITIRNDYLCRGLMLTTKLNGYVSDILDSDSNKIAKEIFNIISKSQNVKHEYEVKISLDEIPKYNLEEKLLESLKWVNNQMLFSFQILEKYNKKNLEDNTIRSILNNL